MSQNQNDTIECVNAEPTPDTSKPPTTTPVKNNSNFQLSTRTIPVSQLGEPSGSASVPAASKVRIDIYIAPKVSQQSSSSENSITLSLFNEHGVQEKKGEFEGEESFATMDTCLKEKMTNTHELTTFSRDYRTQRAIVANSEAPPPYESVPPPAYQSRTPDPRNQAVYYQTVTSGNGGTPRDSPYNYRSPSFQEIEIRHKFVRKVFSILAVQLLFTVGLILLTLFHQPTRQFIRKNLVLLVVAAVMMLVLYIVLICYKATRRIFPLNFILLFLYTLCMSYFCAAASTLTEPKAVLITIGGTSAICFVVALLSFQTWFDITKWWFIILMASMLVLIFGIITLIMSIFANTTVLYLIYSGLLVVLFSVYLLFDMQRILGGRYIEMHPEEYIYGALMMYVDIIMIFLELLNLVRACS